MININFFIEERVDAADQWHTWIGFRYIPLTPEEGNDMAITRSVKMAEEKFSISSFKERVPLKF